MKVYLKETFLIMEAEIVLVLSVCSVGLMQICQMLDGYLNVL